MTRRLSPDPCLAPGCYNKAEWGRAYCGGENCGGIMNAPPPATRCYECGDILIFGEQCHNFQCKVSDTYKPILCEHGFSIPHLTEDGKTTCIPGLRETFKGVDDAKSRGSEEAVGEPGSPSLRDSVEEDRCPYCRRRSGAGEVHISHKQGGDSITMAYVPGVGTVSVKGSMSIYGQGLKIDTILHTSYYGDFSR